MRVLLFSAFLACARAAPSGELVPVVVPAPLPTIPPGDLQAAAIDAQVQAEDQAIYLADQARSLAEQAVETTHEKLVEGDSFVKEQAQEAFWSTEDKKWQAYDALKTAEAEIDGNTAAAAPVLAKSVINGAVLFPTAPLVAPVVYPGIAAPIKEEKQPELALKTAEPSQNLEKEKEKQDSKLEVKFEKPDSKLEQKPASAGPALALAPLPPSLLTPLALAPSLKFEPFLTPVTTFIHPSVAHFPAPIFPAYVK